MYKLGIGYIVWIIILVINIISLSRSSYRYATGVDKTSDAIVANVLGVALIGGIVMYMRNRAHSSRKKEIGASGGVGMSSGRGSVGASKWDIP